jgi:hypothetical protein
MHMSRNWVVSASGAAFAIATFVGLVMLLGGAAVGDTPNSEAADWLAKSGHQAQMMVGMYVMCGGAIAFAIFAAGLVQRLRAADAPELSLTVANISAVAFTALALAAAIGMASAAYAVKSDVEPTPIDPGAVRITTFGFGLWIFGASLAAGTFIASVSVAALATGALPKWLALLGFLMAALTPFAIMFLPSLGVLVWALLVAIVAAVRGSAAQPVRQVPSMA